MTGVNSHQYPSTPSRRKAVGLISGGLDSTLAAKVIKDLGFEVHALYFAMPWGCCDKGRAQEAAHKLGLIFVPLQLDERYLEIIKKPRFGYGSGLNPCVDCRIHMFSRAAKYMEAIGADFVFTGEVVGQRPMSQMPKSLKWIEEHSGLKGRLLRPLSARLLPPTEVELKGIVDRDALLELSGRSRKQQMQLAREWGITDYPSPAGGCLLTDPHFAGRMKDALEHGVSSFRETIPLQWGRHFRLNEVYKVIVGRRHEENEALKHYANETDWILELAHTKGPTSVLKGPSPVPQEIMEQAGGLVQFFSKSKHEQAQWITAHQPMNSHELRRFKARILTESQIDAWRVRPLERTSKQICEKKSQASDTTWMRS